VTVQYLKLTGTFRRKNCMYTVGRSNRKDK
jgi:hypothetical protein